MPTTSLFDNDGTKSKLFGSENKSNSSTSDKNSKSVNFGFGVQTVRKSEATANAENPPKIGESN